MEWTADELSEVCTQYLDFVIENISKRKTQAAKQIYIEKHNITTRIIEKDNELYFSIFKGDKMIDQNNLRYFSNRIKKETPKEIPNKKAMKTELDSLIGTTIEKIFVSDNEIHFYTDKWIFKYGVYWDCCSDSFISDVQDFNKIKWKIVTDIKEIPLEDDGRTRRQEEDTIYWYKIYTEDEPSKFGPLTNAMIFAFRNSSNGYYGWSIYSIGITDNTEWMKEVEDNYISD